MDSSNLQGQNTYLLSCQEVWPYIFRNNLRDGSDSDVEPVLRPESSTMTLRFDGGRAEGLAA